MVFACVCVPSVCCEYEFVGWSGGVRLSILCAPAGAWIVCVCLFVCFVSSALSLSVLSHCVSVSRSPIPLTLALISTSIWLLLPESIIFIMFVFLLPLICNNSCILRDATVCVFFLFLFCFCGGVWFCLLAIAQFVGCCLGVAELLLISWSFYCFLLCVGVIRGML